MSVLKLFVHGCMIFKISLNVGLKHVGQGLNIVWGVIALSHENPDTFEELALQFLVILKSLYSGLFWHFYLYCIECVDTVARQAAMVFKCGVLMYYKNSRGRNYRRQVITSVEGPKLYDTLSSF